MFKQRAQTVRARGLRAPSAAGALNCPPSSRMKWRSRDGDGVAGEGLPEGAEGGRRNGGPHPQTRARGGRAPPGSRLGAMGVKVRSGGL